MPWFKVRDEAGDAVAIVQIGLHEDYNSVGAYVIGHDDYEFERITDAEYKTLLAFDIRLPRLIRADRREIKMTLAGQPLPGATVKRDDTSIIIGYLLPDEVDKYQKPYPFTQLQFNIFGGFQGNIR